MRPDDSWGHIKLGTILFAQGKFIEAERCFRVATECSEGYIDEAYLKLRQELASQEHFEEAEECLKKALAIDPDYRIAELEHADLNAVLGVLHSKKPPHLEEELEKLLARAGENGWTYSAMVPARKLLEIYPNDGPLCVDYAISLTEMARYEEADELLNKAMDLCPENRLCVVYRPMGYLHKARGDLAEAIEWFRKWVKAKPKESCYRIDLGQALMENACFTEAEACFYGASECADGWPNGAYLNLGYALRSQGKYEEAKVCFNKELETGEGSESAELALSDVMKAIQFLHTNRIVGLA